MNKNKKEKRGNNMVMEKELIHKLERYKNYTKAQRKREIDLNDHMWWNYSIYNNPIKPTYFPTNYKGKYGMYDNLNQYSKDKIHCSCPMCSAKTRNKGKRRNLHGNYSPSLNYHISELRRQRSMDADERDYFFT